MSPTTSIRSTIKPMVTKLGLQNTIHEAYWRIKLALHPGIKHHEIAGTTARFNVTNRVEYRRLRDFWGEGPIIADILSELESGDIVYDVGANIGGFTCFMAKQLSPEQVVAFEPHPSNLFALRSNLELNNTDATIVNRALGATKGTAELAVASHYTGEGKHFIATDDTEQTIEVKIAVGDELINKEKLPAPTVLKIDVEGAEQRVLRGLETTLARAECRLCYIEVHPKRISNYGDSVEDMDTLLKSSGFDLTVLQDRGDEYFVKATKSE